MKKVIFYILCIISLVFLFPVILTSRFKALETVTGNTVIPSENSINKKVDGTNNPCKNEMVLKSIRKRGRR